MLTYFIDKDIKINKINQENTYPKALILTPKL